MSCIVCISVNVQEHECTWSLKPAETIILAVYLFTGLYITLAVLIFISAKYLIQTLEDL